MSKFIENKLIEEFKGRKHFTREELLDFYRHYEPELKEGTFAWRIYDLKNRNIIRPVKRGLYVISYKPIYTPHVSPDLLKIAKQVTARFEEIKYCIWETAWLNEFTRHQLSRSILLIEIEKGFEESLFFELKDSLQKEIFLNPGEKAIDLYIAESNRPLIIKKSLTRAPLAKRKENKTRFYVPTLEKILVDLFAEKKLFYYVQGSELIHIYENAITNYSINFTRLFSYAKRREREKDLKQFMSNHLFHLVKNIIDD